MNASIKPFKDLITDKGVFSDGNWVESKDQDPLGDVRLIQLADIGVGKFINKSKRFMTSQKASDLNCTFLEEGDILIARMPDPIGRACIFPGVGCKAVTVVDICIVRPNNAEIDSRWLMHLINSNKFNHQILQYVTGTTRQRISRGNLAKLDVEVPPLAEQKRIAAILDKADAIRQKRKQAIDLADEFLRSVFLDMFGDPVTNPKGWEVKLMSDLTSKITDGTHKTPTYTESGVPFLSAKNIKPWGLDWGDTKFVSQEEHEMLIKRCNPERGDIILSKSGSLGTPAIINTDKEFSLFESAALFKLRKDLIESEYIYHFMKSKPAKYAMLKNTKGVAIKHLHLKELKELEVICPPKDLRVKFINIAQQVASTLSKQNCGEGDIEQCFSSLSQKAFNGEL